MLRFQCGGCQRGFCNVEGFMNHLWDRDDSSPCVVYGSEWADTAAEIAAEQRVAVMIMDSLRSCNERVVAFATHSIQLLLVLLPVEHCALRCQKSVAKQHASSRRNLGKGCRSERGCIHLNFDKDISMLLRFR